MEQPTSDLNVLSDGFLADPHGAFARARSRGAVIHEPTWGLWWTLRHEEVSFVLRSPQFVKDPRKAMPSAFTDVLIAHRQGASLLLMDGDEHTRIRGLVADAFSAASAEAMRERATDLAHVLLDRIGDDAVFDVVSGLATPLPVRVLAEILGIEAARTDDFARWSYDAFLSLQPFNSPDKLEQLTVSRAESVAYYREAIARRRSDATDDLISRLVVARESDPSRISEDEIVALIGALVVAGTFTTTDLISNTVLALLSNRAQWDAIRDDATLVAASVDEALRFDPPAYAADRIASADMEIAGAPIQKGEWVRASLAAAARDPALNPDPDTFDVCRQPRRHVAFGGGRHYCLGAPLARVIAESAVGALVRRFPALALDESTPPVRRSIPGFRGVARLEVRTHTDVATGRLSEPG